MALAANEEAMRLKNEHAYARAVQNDNKSYTPSVNAIIVKQSVDYPQSHRVSKQSRIVQRLEHELVQLTERKSNNIVS